ncbi:MAG: rhomboid family intramembrane serine protease [Bacteroidales bacterium]|jgi:membrane associated rhomboid family serine protease|nr:rhomboid family intramembrane serine protease [Bacteroidales bacterium]
MITLVIIAITALVSIIAFSKREILSSLMFNAYSVYNEKKYYRLFSYGLVHGGFSHLFFNMLTLFFFGRYAEEWFRAAWGQTGGNVLFAVMYVSAIAVSSVADLVKHRNNPNYNAVGASGAVSAVLFASVFFDPKMGIYMYFIPVPIPAFIFAPLYLVYCQWMARRNMDNIGHTAHFWGAVYGFVFPLVCRPSLIQHFLHSLGL